MPQVVHRLIAIDIDGTLLDPSGVIGDADQRALRAAAARGATLFICTGRGYQSALPILAQLEVPAHVALHNGAKVIDPAHEPLWHTYIDQRVLAPAVAAVRAAELTPMLYVQHAREVCLTLEPTALQDPRFTSYLRNKQSILRPAVDVLSQIGSGALGVVSFGPGTAVQRAVAALEPLGDSLFSWWSTFHRAAQTPAAEPALVFEAVARGATKGAAVARLAAQLQVPHEQVVAIGDNINDLDMLQVAGTAVAMANADEQVKAIADWVTASNRECGVARALERYVLS